MKRILKTLVIAIILYALILPVNIQACIVCENKFDFFIEKLDFIEFISDLDFINEDLKLKIAISVIEERNSNLEKMNINLYPVDTRINIQETDNISSINRKIDEILNKIDMYAVEYTYEDILYLSKAIMFEAGKDWSEDLRLSVGNVVINRVISDKFPNSIREVVEQDGQYETIDQINSIAPNDIPIECIESAKSLLNGTTVFPDYVVYQANFKIGTVYKIIEEKSQWYSFTMYFGY